MSDGWEMAPDDRARSGAQPPRGSRSNGLTAGAFVPLVDVDPRVAEVLLVALARVGIAGYVAPVSGSVGGYLEVRLPSRPTDRLFVDPRFRDAARAVVDAELADVAALLSDDAAAGGPAVAVPLTRAQPVPSPATPTPSPAGPLDEEAAWQEIVAGWTLPASTPVPPWPVREDVDETVRGDVDEPTAPSPSASEGPAGAAPRRRRTDLPRVEPTAVRDPVVPEPAAEEPEEHYEPPPPPPVGRPAQHILYAAVAAALGGVLLLAPGLVGQHATTGVMAVGVALIAGAAAALIWRMGDWGPDDTPDDGAIV